MQQKIIILDFGSQTTQLIGRRVRELDTFCEILPYNKYPEDDADVIGVILSGSPYSVHDPEAFKVNLERFMGRLPVLGICYGAQFISHTLGGRVEKAGSREYGRANLMTFDKENPLFKGFTDNSQVWMSHGDTITAIPAGFECIASTNDVKYAAYAATDRPVWAVQFHPEVFHTVQGTQLLRNFVVDICGSKQNWSAASFVDTTVAELKEQLGDDRVILGLSGGVDSSVAAVLLNRAIGKNLTCIFVDHGMLRKNEFTDVMHDYECLGLNVIGVDASEKFFKDLEGVTDPEQKRKIIGRDFVEVFNAEAKKITGAKWLAQGTIYPDRIESLNITGKVIKSHHNVGGLPEEMHLQLCEPLKWLFKDEVRRVGRQLEMPEHLITRHPFPGPGLAVRILGDISYACCLQYRVVLIYSRFSIGILCFNNIFNQRVCINLKVCVIALGVKCVQISVTCIVGIKSVGGLPFVRNAVFITVYRCFPCFRAKPWIWIGSFIVRNDVCTFVYNTLPSVE